ncbi:adenylate/guanylate cyclase domain-containing protein [Bradyrhizobium sp. Ec3.3]|uniref:adenylate/guanylate cyclase domain-containing protein n=1 Tax=Bradyrhizobium sp. Ec3.3 TaxID=189753 RepID=UPI000486F5AB|nr:adenylate/guanylate cyclase domain-containing protein [Bradyrhizobium sp. Ec3.3]
MEPAQPPRVGRRLAAIVAADVAGYSRLMGLDEVGTARTLLEHRKVTDSLVAKHGGRLVKTTGDGVLLEFPSVVDAVECAVAVQAVMAERNQGVPEDRRMLLRIGINLGDILIDGEDILGDGVNIAARLEGIAEPGAICISSSAFEQVRDKVPVDFADLGEQALKNIARPIRAYAIGLSANARRPAPLSTLAPRLSIVVLPFANIGGGPDQDYFVDGVTESLTTDLSRINGAFVIARNTAFTFKGKAVNVKQVGRELNVRYVLEGSVQRGGDRLRVNVQLIDAESGNHLWAERFDKTVVDLFDMQDEIAAHVARQLDTALIAAEARRAAQSTIPDSTDLYFQGMAWANKGITPNHLMQAHGFFERALALDPDNVEALIGTAGVEITLAGAYTTDDRAARLAAASAALTKALSLAPNQALAHLFLGRLLIFSNRGHQAIAECERALALDRNLAAAHATIGLAKFFIGRSEETEAHVREALRLSPRDTFAFSWIASAGVAKLYLGDDREAVTWLRHAIEINRNLPNAYFYLAAALSNLGQVNEAEVAVTKGLAINPTYTINGFRTGPSSDNPTFLAQRERIYKGMQMAGVPEG